MIANKCSVPWEQFYRCVKTDVNVCGIIYWGGGARTATERMCTVALGYITIFLQKQIVETFLSSTIKNSNIAHLYEWDIRFVVLKLGTFFPPFIILAEHALQIAMGLSSSDTERNFQTGEDMFTNDDVMSATQAESHCSLMLQSLAFGKRMNLR